MTETSNPNSKPLRDHHRETRRQIWMPFFLFSIFLLIIIGITIVLNDTQTALVTNWMYMVFVLCPATICLIPLFIAVFVGIFGMRRLQDSSLPPMQRLEQMIVGVDSRVTGFSERVNTTMQNMSERVQPVVDKVDIFAESESSEGDHESVSDHTPKS